jgi:hypothetical protein
MSIPLSDRLNTLYTHAITLDQVIDELNSMDDENLNEIEQLDLMAFKSYIRRVFMNLIEEEHKLSGLVTYHYTVIYTREYSDPLELKDWLDNMLKIEGLKLVSTVGDYFIFDDKDGRERPDDPERQ